LIEKKGRTGRGGKGGEGLGKARGLWEAVCYPLRQSQGEGAGLRQRSATFGRSEGRRKRVLGISYSRNARDGGLDKGSAFTEPSKKNVPELIPKTG